MTKRRKQAIILLALSVPMLWFGFSNFMAGGISSTALAIGISLACTLGMLFALSGLVMLITKNSLGIWNPDDKGRGEDLLASQTSKGSPILDKAKIKRQNQKAVDEFAEKIRDETRKETLKLNKPKEVLPMATLTPAERMNKLDELIEENKAFEKIMATNKKAQAEMRADIKEDGFVQNKDGIWVPIKKKPVA